MKYQLLLSSWCVPKANVGGILVLEAQTRQAGFRQVSIQSVGARVVPGAARYFRGEEYGRIYRTVKGPWQHRFMRFVFKELDKAHRAGIFDYVLIQADK